MAPGEEPEGLAVISDNTLSSPSHPVNPDLLILATAAGLPAMGPDPNVACWRLYRDQNNEDLHPPHRGQAAGTHQPDGRCLSRAGQRRLTA